MIRILITILYIYYFHYSLAIDNFYGGARSAAMANCNLNNSDIWSISGNQAGLSKIENLQFSVFNQNRFLIKELNLSAAAIAIPINNNTTIGTQYNYFGYSKYYESKIGLSFAHLFGNKVAIGTQIDIFDIYQYGKPKNGKTISFELGIQIKLSDEIQIGTAVINPLFITKVENIDIPSIYSFGFLYNINKYAIFCAEYENNSMIKSFIKSGFEYTLKQQFAFRCGISTGMYKYSAGLGYTYKQLIIDLAFSYHQSLGTSPSFALTYIFPNKK